MSSTEKAAAVSEKTTTAAQKASSGAGIKAQEPLMYIGPTIPGIGIQNTVYAEISGEVKEAAKGLPVLLDLFIPIRKYPDAELQIRKKSGRLSSAFVKALELKETKKGGKTE